MVPPQIASWQLPPPDAAPANGSSFNNNRGQKRGRDEADVRSPPSPLLPSLADPTVFRLLRPFRRRTTRSSSLPGESKPSSSLATRSEPPSRRPTRSTTRSQTLPRPRARVFLATSASSFASRAGGSARSPRGRAEREAAATARAQGPGRGRARQLQGQAGYPLRSATRTRNGAHSRHDSRRSSTRRSCRQSSSSTYSRLKLSLQSSSSRTTTAGRP